MGIIIRQSVQNTIISYAGVVLGFVITIWLYPSILTAEQYGLTRVLLSLAMVSTQFANLGIKNTIIRYFPFFRDKEKNHNGFLFLSLLVPFAGMLALSLILYVFRPQITSYFIDKSALLVNYYWYILPLAFFILFFHVFSNFVQALYDTVMSSFLMNILLRTLTIGALVIYLLSWITFKQFIIIFVASYGVIMLLMMAYTFFAFSVDFKPRLDYLRKSLVKSMFNYSIFAFLGGLTSIIVSNIDLIMLGALAGLQDTGIYAIAFYVGAAITIPRQSIYQISSPLIADAFKARDFGLIENLYKRSSLNQIIAGGLLFCGIAANLSNLIHLLPPEYAHGTFTVILIIGAANVFDMASGLNGAIILNSKYYRFDLYATAFLIGLTILLNYLLIPIYGIIGAAIGTGIAVCLYNTLKMIYVEVRFSIQPFQWRELWILLIAVITLSIISQMPTLFNTYADLILRSGAVSLLYLLPVFGLQISEDFNNLMYASLNRIRSFFS